MIRQKLYPHADSVLRAISDDTLYAAYELDESERVGEVPHYGAGDFANHLTTPQSGYEDSGLLSALKYSPNTDKLITDDYSIRKIDPVNPTWQWHVHLFQIGHRVMVYSHYEKRPDPEPIADEITMASAVERLKCHYKPYKYGARDKINYYRRGTTCALVAETINSVGGDTTENLNRNTVG